MQGVDYSRKFEAKSAKAFTLVLRPFAFPFIRNIKKIGLIAMPFKGTVA
jgi:hypothetical protein